MPGIIRRAVRRLREAQVADSGGSGMPAPGGSAVMSKGVLGAPARKRWRLAVLPGGPHHREPSVRQGRRAARRPRCTRSACATRSCTCSAGCASSRSSRPARTGHCSRRPQPSTVPGGPGADLHHRGRPRRRGNRYPTPRPAAAEIWQHLTYQPRRGRPVRHVSEDGRPPPLDQRAVHLRRTHKRACQSLPDDHHLFET